MWLNYFAQHKRPVEAKKSPRNDLQTWFMRPTKDLSRKRQILSAQRTFLAKNIFQLGREIFGQKCAADNSCDQLRLLRVEHGSKPLLKAQQ